MADQLETTRRTFLVSAGAATLTVCLGGCAAAGGTTSAATGGSAATTVPVAEVPVGGGTIVGNFVVTQPTQGNFKAFGYLCSHQKLPVQQVTDAAIVCGRHGSTYSLADGSVITGPATAPLTPAVVTVSGDSLTVTA